MRKACGLSLALGSALLIVACGFRDDRRGSGRSDGTLDTDIDLDTDTDTDVDGDTDLSIDLDVDGDVDPGTAPASIKDPCGDFDTPGAYDVDGGPTIDLPDGFSFDAEVTDATVFELTSADTHPVTGNDGDGAWYLKRLGAREGLNGGGIATGDDGSFDLTLPLFCGDQLLKSSWTNASGRYCLVQSISNLNCLEGDIRVTLSWGAGAFDLELHLIRDGGQINNGDSGNSDCTWTNMNPDWGIASDTSDDPTKDVDWTGDNGIENIYLPNPENTVYHVLVEYWRSGEPTTAKVVFNVDGETTVAELRDFNLYEVWYVGTIDWSSRKVTLLDQVIPCADDWASGCLLDIP